MNKNNQAAIAFGRALKKYREKRGLSKQKLAYEAELDVSTIKSLERGLYGVSFYALFSIASALQVSPSILIKETESILASAHEDVK